MNNNVVIKTLLVISMLCIVRSISYDKVESLDYLYYQKASYCPKSNITHWECGQICQFHPNMKDIRVYFNATHAAQGYVGYNKNQIVVAFRGSTRTVTNWLYNFDIAKSNFVQCEKCSVHAGFYKTYLDIKEQLFENIKVILKKYPEVPIVITGHSLGGAVATIAAIDIQHFLHQNGLTNQIKEVHTFGSPRVGNTAFADYYNKLLPQTVRVVHNKDIVPHAPPSLIGYYHVGTEIWLDADSNNYKICNQFEEDKTCSSSVKSPSITDHVTYLNNNTGCRYPDQKVICIDEQNKEDCNDQDIQDDDDEDNIQSKFKLAKMMLLTNQHFQS